MARKRYSPEQIIGYLRESEVLLSKGSTVPEVCPLKICVGKIGPRQITAR